jgi:hypothetical protein
MYMQTTSTIDTDAIMERFDMDDDKRRVRTAASKAQRVRRDSRGRQVVR